MFRQNSHGRISEGLAAFHDTSYGHGHNATGPHAGVIKHDRIEWDSDVLLHAATNFQAKCYASISSIGVDEMQERLSRLTSVDIFRDCFC